MSVVRGQLSCSRSNLVLQRVLISPSFFFFLSWKPNNGSVADASSSWWLLRVGVAACSCQRSLVRMGLAAEGKSKIVSFAAEPKGRLSFVGLACVFAWRNLWRSETSERKKGGEKDFFLFFFQKTMMENPTLLVAFMLQAESGLKTMERAYDSGEMAKRTFAGHEAVAWLSAELPLNEEEACLAMQNTLRMRLVESLDGGALAEFVPSALYKFADEAKVIAPARRDYLRSSSDGHASAANHQDLMGHFHTLIWFSYRQEFPEIVPTPFRSDVGWGCMLRTGQMMLANVLQRRLLGSKWRLGASTEQEMVRHRAILSLFYGNKENEEGNVL